MSIKFSAIQEKALEQCKKNAQASVDGKKKIVSIQELTQGKESKISFKLVFEDNPEWKGPVALSDAGGGCDYEVTICKFGRVESRPIQPGYEFEHNRKMMF